MTTVIRKLLASASVLLLCGWALVAQNVAVTGKVLDENGEPLIGAGVFDKNNSAKGTVTDIDGKFILEVPSDTFLEISFIGYETKIEAVDSRKDITVKLQPKTSTLDDVVVIGYGTSKKGDLTGSVAVVEMGDLQSTAASNVAQSLQGRIAGAQFSSQTGAPGEAGTIQIRGARSISAGNEPLIILDGMMDVVEDLSEINPADIVSISVLKDVSSTAIYGSRGANGVILVTTTATSQEKEKQVGTFNIKFNAKAGVSGIANRIDIMDASEIAQWRNMVYAARNNWGMYGETLDNYPYADPLGMGKGTDWVDILSQNAVYQDYHLSLNGNSGKSRYSASIGYNDEQGVIIGSGNKKISSVLSYNVWLKPWMQAGVRASLTDTRTDFTSAKISGTNTSAAIFVSPLLTTGDEWNLYGDDESSGGAIFNNPYIVAKHATQWLRRNTIVFAPWLNADIIKGLKLRVKFSYARNNTWNFSYSPSYLPTAAYNKLGGTATRGAYLKQTLINENTLNYNTKIKKSSIEAVLGLSVEYKKIDSENLTGAGYLDDDVSYNNMNGIIDYGNLVPKSSQTINKKMSVFGRLNYSWNRRYYVTATLRADGASNFASNKKWGFFPAVALRWSIVNEDWFSRAYWLNDLSLRVSAGRSGNDAISNYMSLATLSSAKTHWTFGDSRSVAYYPNKLANSNLTWETTDSYDVGLNFEAFRSRLNIEADAYLSYTHDLLLSMRTSQVTGYDTYFNNIGSTRNMGVELTIKSKNFVRKNFKWNTTFTIAHNRQMTLEIGEGDAVVPTYMNPRNSSQYLYGYKKGYPVNSLWGYQFAGIWKDEDDFYRNESTHAYTSGNMMSSLKNNLGRTKYVDINHDGLLNEEDVVYLGCSDPVVYGGIANDFTIAKRLTVGVYFTYSLGGQMYNLSELWLGTGSSAHNKYRYMLDAWTPENPDSDIPAPYRDDYYGCSRFIHDASYLRLKTVSVEYNVPLPKKINRFVKSLIVGVSGENLYLWKNYNGFDPDVNTSSAVYRLDNGSFPRPRTVIGKVSLVF